MVQYLIERQIHNFICKENRDPKIMVMNPVTLNMLTNEICCGNPPELDVTPDCFKYRGIKIFRSYDVPECEIEM